MDEKDVRGGNILNGSDKEIEESLKKALAGNEAQGRKGKTFGTVKRLPTQVTENFSAELSKTTEAVAPQVRATEFKTTALSSTQTRLKPTTLMPESITENENNEEIEIILRTKSLYSTRNKVTTLKPETSTNYEEDLESTTRSNIYKARPSRLPFKDVVKKSESFTDGISFSTERVEESTFWDDLTEENEETTTFFSIPHKVENFEVNTKAEPTTDNINKISVSDHEFENSKPTKSSTKNSNIKKVENVTVKILEELESTSEKYLLEETTESAFTTEEATTISLSPKNVLVKKRISTTPPAIEAESATEIDSNLENTTEISNDEEGETKENFITSNKSPITTTTESPSNPIATTKRSFSRLIRYGTTTPQSHKLGNQKDEDKDQEKIETSQRGFKRFQISTTEVVNEDINSTLESNNKTLKDKEVSSKGISTNRSLFGGLTTTKTFAPETSQSSRSFVLNGSNTTSTITTDKEDSTTKQTTPTRRSFEGLTRPTTAFTETATEKAEIARENKEENTTERSLLIRRTFGGPTQITTTETTSVETNSIIENNDESTLKEEVYTIAESSQDATTKATIEGISSTLLYVRESSSNEEDSTDLPTEASIDNAYSTDINSEVFSNNKATENSINNSESMEKYNSSVSKGTNENFDSTTENFTESIEFIPTTVKAALEEAESTPVNNKYTTSKDFNQDITKVTESTTEKDGSTVDFNEDSEEVTTQRTLPSIRSETENETTIKNRGSTEEVTTKRSLPSRTQFGGFNRPTTTQHIFDDAGSTVGKDTIEEEATTERTVPTIRPFRGFNQQTTNQVIVEENISTEKETEDSTTIDEATTKGTLPTRRPFGKLNRSSATTQATIEENETTIKNSGSTEEVTTKRSLPSRRQFGGFNRPTTTQNIFDDAGSTVGKDTIEEEATSERTVPTIRPFRGFNQLITTHAIVEENISTEKETEDSTTIDEATTKGTLPTRRPFGKLNRSSATTQATIEESETTIKDSGSTEEVTTKRILPSRRPFGGFNRPTTMQNIFDDAGSTVGDDTREEEATTERTVPTRRTFRGFNQRTTTQAIVEENISTGKETEDNTTRDEATTKRTLPTRRPFGRINRTSSSTQATIDITDDTEDSRTQEEATTKRTLPTRRSFGGFKRPTVGTKEATIPETESLIEESYKNFANEEVQSKHTLPTLTASQNVKSDIDDTAAEEITTTRRSFGGFTRPTTTTTEATTQKNDSAVEIKKETILNSEISSKRTLFTRKPFVRFTRLPTTTTEKLDQDIDETSTRRPFSASKLNEFTTIEATIEKSTDESIPATSTQNEDISTTENESTKSVIETNFKTNKEIQTQSVEHQKTLTEIFEASTVKEAWETSTPTSETFTDNENSSTTEFESAISITKAAVQRNDNINTDSLKYQETKSETLKPNTIEEALEISTHASVEETSTPRHKAIIRKRIRLPTTTTIIPITSEPETYEEQNKDIDALENENTKAIGIALKENIEDNKTTNLHLVTAPNPQSFIISTSSASSTPPEESDNEYTTSRKLLTPTNHSGTFNSKTATYIPINTDESSDIDREEATTSEDTEIYSTTSNTTTAKSPNPKESNSEKEFSDSEDHIDLTTHRTLGSFNQRLNLNSKKDINRNLYNRKNQQNKEREEEETDVTTRRSFSIFRPSSQNQAERKLRLKPLNLDKPRLKLSLSKRPQTDNEEEYNEDELEADISDTDDLDEEYLDHEKKYTTEENQLASQELASKESSSSLLALRNRVRLGQTQIKENEQGLVNDRLKNILHSRIKTQTTTIVNGNTSKSSDLTTGDTDKEVAITNTVATNTTWFGTNRRNSTVANYLNRIKTNLSKTNTNTAPSHRNQDNIKLDSDQVDDDRGEDNEEEREDDSYSNKSNVNDFKNNINKGDDNDSKRRFQKYKFQRRITTTSTTTTTENPDEAKEEIDVAKKYGAIRTQVNDNEAKESERETSTILPDTTAPITTESLSRPATPLPRRIKVLKLKRPVVSNINNTNTNITVNAIASNATNSNTSHTDTQNIVKLSIVNEVDSQIAKTQTLTETETIETQTPIPSPLQTSPTPKRIRKVIRKLIRPVNRTTEISNESENSEKSSVTTSTFLQRRQNVSRIGYNRSSKFQTLAKVKEESSEETNYYKNDQTDEKKSEALSSRGINKFTLPSVVTSTSKTSLFGSANRNRFGNRQQSSTTIGVSNTKEDDEEYDEDYDDNEEDDNEEEEEESEEEEEQDILNITPKLDSSLANTSANSLGLPRPLPTTTKSSIISSELETTTLIENESQNFEETTSTKLLNSDNLGNKTKTEQPAEQQEMVLSDRIRAINTSHGEEKSDDPLLKLRNKVKQDLAKVNQEEGVLSTRFKSIKTASEEEESKKSDPLLKLRNKVKQDLTKSNQVEGVLSDRFKSTKVPSDEEEVEKDDPLFKLRNKVKQDLAKNNKVEGVLSNRLNANKTEADAEDQEDPLLKLRNKVKQELTKDSQEEGVVSVKLKKLLEAKNTSNTLSFKVEDDEQGETTVQNSLNLQKIRDKVQTNLANGEQDQGVVSSKLKKLQTEKISSSTIPTSSIEDVEENEETTELNETSETEELLESSKPLSSRKPFLPKYKLTSVDSENQKESDETEESTTSAPKIKPTFRRKLVAKRPYVPTKPPPNALSSTTIGIPTTEGKKKYFKRKFGRFHPFNASNRNTGEGYVRKDPRGNILPGTNRFKFEGSDRESKNDEGEDYEEYDEVEAGKTKDEVEEEEEEDVATKPVQPIQTVKPIIPRPPGLFNRPQSTILKKPLTLPKEEGSGENEDKNEDEVEEEDDNDNEDDEEEEYEDEEKEENEQESFQEDDKTDSNPPIYKPKDNRIPPGARPTLTTTPTIKKPFSSTRVANAPYRPSSVTTTVPSNRANRFGFSSRSTVKPRVVNRPLGVSVPNLTIKPVANDYERTTVLIPTKPAPFINPNTRAYERKYTGPSTEISVDLNYDSNPLIDDLNIEALNARNKKIFDINSKKHTNLKPKVITPLAKSNENTQEQQHINTEYENDYQTTVSGVAPNLNSNTNTQEQYTTQGNTIIGTQNTEEANQSNLNNLNEISSQDGFTTTPSPSSNLLHIFTVADAEHTTQYPLEDGFQVVPRLIVERVKPKHKVVEINRIVEVNSKEEKLRRKSKANTIVPVEGSQTYKIESLPHVEQLGEISVVKYVHQVDGSDITIEGRSTVTDYTPTEQPVLLASQPVRHSLPDGSVEERYGKALVPEVIREAIETSTISLEGLFESARKGKVLNTIIEDGDLLSASQAIADEIVASTKSSHNINDKRTTETTEAPLEVKSSTESFNILKSIAFDIAKINLEPNSEETETQKNNLEATTESNSSSSTSSITTKKNQEENQQFSSIPVLTTTPSPETYNEESSTTKPEETKATTVAAALFPQYLRTPATVNGNGLTVTRRPVLSVRRRLINSSTSATATSAAAANTQQTTTPSQTTQTDSSSTINDEYITTSKFKRLRTNRPPTLNSAAVDITPDTTAATSFKANNKFKKNSPEATSNDLKLASSLLTSSSSADNDISTKQISKTQTSTALRRKFQARRLTTTTTSNTNSDGSVTEQPRTQNPLFKRRYSLTTYSPLSVKSGQPSKPATTSSSTTTAISPAPSTLQTVIDSLTTTVYVDGLENDEATDQVAKSSIHTSRFNQINGRLHIDEDDEEELDAGANSGDVRHVVNTVKPLTTLSSVTRQPASRFLQPQSQQQHYSKYNVDDVITRRMDGTGIVGKSSTGSSSSTTTTIATSTTTTPAVVIKKRKMVIKRKPQKATPSSEESLASKQRRRPHKYQEPFNRLNSNQAKSNVKTSTQPGRTYRPNLDYDYYDEEDVRLVGNRSDQQLKVILHGGGIIECLDQGNFPHPLSCRKFISCAKFETGGVVGWEYTCPKGLSYDPVGGMCNWAAGLGCKE